MDSGEFLYVRGVGVPHRPLQHQTNALAISDDSDDQPWR